MDTEDSSSQPLLCPNGHQVAPGVRFCPECGAAINAAASAQLPVPPESPPDSTPEKSRNMVPLLVGGAVFLVAVVVAAILLLEGGGQTIEGSFTLFDPELGSDCQGSGGYSDIGPGAPVTVRNQAGETIATGRIGQGEFASGVGCDYKFTVEDVPDAEFYAIEVSHRGALEYSREEMEAQAWTVSLSLGDAGS